MARPSAPGLIVALDVPTEAEALRLIDDLEGLVSFFKIGLELTLSGGARAVTEAAASRRFFLDLKLPDDIDETIRRVVQLSTSMPQVELLTLSGSAHVRTIRAAVAGRGAATAPKLLFVPLLSSMSHEDLGATPAAAEAHVLERATVALDAGCDGLIASGAAIGLLRSAFSEALIVSPGIRPAGQAHDDHKRSASPSEAVRLGADYLVVGRPIRDAGDRHARRRAARDIVDEMESALAS